jgi:hypothetical protein
MHLILATTFLGSQSACLEERSELENLPPQSLVFVLDNSGSMTNEAEALSLNLDDLWDGIIIPAVGDIGSDESTYADVAIGVTTTSISGSQAGAAGALIQPALNAQQGGEAHFQVQRDVLCSATCWDPSDPANPMPSDPDYECNEDDPTVPDSTSYEFLDCVCGSQSWESGAACGSGDEEGLEAAFLTMCRTFPVGQLPEECFDAVYSPLTDADIESNAGLVREDSTVTFFIISDEGDGSRRLENQNSDPSPYLDLLNKFNMQYRFAVVGPPYECTVDDEGRETCMLTCNSGGATTWGSERYQQAAEASGGFYNFIAEEDAGGDCRVSRFSDHLADLASLLTD